MQDTRSLKDQHPAVVPGWASALVPLLQGGERTSAGNRRVRREQCAQTWGTGRVKLKYGKVKGRLRRVGPCRGLHRGDWSERGDMV
jgi:hypothetical protein